MGYSLTPPHSEIWAYREKMAVYAQKVGKEAPPHGEIWAYREKVVKYAQKAGTEAPRAMKFGHIERK